MSGTIRRRDFFLKTRDGVRIAVREVFDAAAGTPARPMILMHGTRIPARHPAPRIVCRVRV